MKPRIDKEVIKEVRPEEIPEIKRLALLLRTASQADIASVSVMGGGLTNRNFKVELTNGQKVAVRIAGEGTQDYMNRPAEKHNCGLMSSLGINAEVYFFDTRTGSQLSQFIEGDTLHSEDFRTKDEILEKAAAIMRKYHDSGFEFSDTFSPFKEIQRYNKILSDSNFTDRYDEGPDLAEHIIDVMEAYAENPPKLVPCHNDPLPENFMYDGERLYLIDWEYAGMNDRFFDLAALIDENELDDDAQRKFLKYYFGGDFTQEQEARVYVARFLVDAMWAIWSLVQINSGKDRAFYRAYGEKRIKECMVYVSNPNWSKYLEIVTNSKI